jgi:Glycosyl hydrolases family 2, sugar binding domain/Glycosyl hydrolases family 2/Glycosyl hydrolases family 2, TIM barrel domain
MKKLLILLLAISSCTNQKLEVRKSFSLAGEWKFKIDSLDQGIKENWFNTSFEETVKLPGSMAENGKGDEVSLKTNWTGDIIDKSYFTDSKYEKYRQPGNIKIPFWLKPVKYYKGAAWYQKEIELPSAWHDKNIILFLERPHWESKVFVNGKNAGSANSLAVPHQYNITDLLIPGKNLITIRIDNRVVIPVGVNSHSISDHTQSNWNGIAGDISLKATSKVFINKVAIYPNVPGSKARIFIKIDNTSETPFRGKVLLEAESFNSGISEKIKSKIEELSITGDMLQMEIDLPLGSKIKLWNEFAPSLYKLSVSLKGHRGEVVDQYVQEFGMRDFKTEGTHFTINGQTIFLRGTVECCIFPLTGYPPTDVKSWHKVLQTCKDYGLNTIRFHSWCPPEAAFIAADRLGMYFQVECSSWANQGTTLGDGGELDRFIYSESDRIMQAYGNHPSFCMLAYGNEPAGNNQNEYLGKLLTYWKSKDNRRVYTSAAGWPFIPENDYNLSPEPRIQRWGEGLKSIINSQPPRTDFDYRDYVSKFTIPVVSHEIGQWCVYPDFSEIAKYTGVLKATNFEIFRETLNENNIGGQAHDFLMASGKLQALCYKAEIEAALRTPGFAGFHLLQLHDFPGQGTALVGILNPFFESKGYITPEEFRMFCNQTVPLARMSKLIYRNNEFFNADIEVAHFGEKPLARQVIACRILNSRGEEINNKSFTKDVIGIGNCIQVGTMSFDLSAIHSAQKLTFEVSLEKTSYRNKWDFWVYPSRQIAVHGDVLITDKLDKKAQDELNRGGSVLFLTYGQVGKEKGARVAIGFSSIFWNTAWTNNQPPHTLGILCDPKNALFKDFPTEYHSNWQWWDPVTHSQAMIINGFPANLKPLIQPIDTWFENRRLALAFESKTGNGKLMVCSIDLKNNMYDRPVSQQLLISLLNYMNSPSFNPQTDLSLNEVKGLLNDSN